MSGTATNGTDYTTLSGTATISAGNSTATVTLATTDDADYEGLQSAILGVNTGTGYNVGSPSSATLYITDNDSPPTVTVSSSGSPSEAGATGTITVTRTGTTTDPLVVNVSTLGGTATNGTDFSTIGSTITIGAGQSSATATVTPTDDANVEPTESIFFAAVSGTGYNVGSPSSVTLYIADNDYVTVTRPQTSIPGWLAVC